MVIATLLALATPALAQPPVSATDAWVRAAPPGATMMAGYLTLHNTSREAIRLTAVESPQFEGITLHRGTLVDGVARMEAVAAIEVPARGSVSLAPGGLHLMLEGPIGAVRDGGTVDLVLSFDNGWSLELNVPVRRP